MDSRTLKKEPWAGKTSLLVLPGGADLPMCKELNGEGNAAIRDFVRRGGAFLGFCAGGYYASARCEFAKGDPLMEVSGSRDLRFFPGTARGPAFAGFDYGSEKGAQVAKVAVNSAALGADIDYSYHYYNGGAVFVDADQYDKVTVLGQYVDELSCDPGTCQAAAVLCQVGSGRAILTGTHPEFVPEIMKLDHDDDEYMELVRQLQESNESRQLFLRSCLRLLGLRVNDNEVVRPRITPLNLCSPIPHKVDELMAQIVADVGLSSQNLLEGTADSFRIHSEDYSLAHQLDKQEEYEDPDTAIKELIVYRSTLPDRKATPYFDIRQYFRLLQQNHGQIDLSGKAGSILLYGEVITSTSSILDKNFNILKHLPTGLVAAANVQVSGRGRGGNIWINPPGVCASSLVYEIPLVYKHAPVVFVQYLTSLAVVEAITTMGEGYDELPIRIKWPNDIYAIKPEFFGQQFDANEHEPTYVKIGGILVNTNVIDGNYKTIIGTGVNLSNAHPTTSINSTINLLNEVRVKRGQNRLEPISTEMYLAKYMYCMEKLFRLFLNQGFKPLLPMYYKHWLHSNQIVHLQDHGNTRAKLTGITHDWGMLVAEEVDRYDKPTGAKFQLQPDGNSFDMFKGLISKKQ